MIMKLVYRAPDTRDTELERYLNQVHRPDNMSPFIAGISRHLLDGNRTFTEDWKRERQADDAERYQALLNSEYILRPERGDTAFYVTNNEHAPIRSPFTHVFKTLYRGKWSDLRYPLNIAMRFASPFVVINGVVFYIHLEILPWAIKDRSGKITGKNPRVFKKTQGTVTPYKVDSSRVMTVRFDPSATPLVSQFLEKSTHDPNTEVTGTLTWKQFLTHPFFAKACKELMGEVGAECRRHMIQTSRHSVISNLSIAEHAQTTGV